MSCEKIIIGSANFASEYGYNRDKVVDHYELALALKKAKINSIDSAVEYKCQHILRKYYADFEIDTKVSYETVSMDTLGDVVEKFIDDCHLSKIRTLYVHDAWNIPQNQYCGFVEKLQELRQRELIDEVGLSIYWDQLNYDLSNIDRIQVPFSIMHGKALKYIKNFKKTDIKITIRNIFLQGRLLKKNDYEYFSTLEEKDIVRSKVKPESYGKRLRTALSILNKNEIDNVILGIDNPSHIRDILRNSNIDKPDFFQIDLPLLDPRNW